VRILFVGDVVGRAGRTAVSEHLPGMIRDWALDLVVVNGENAAGGFGITEAIYQEFVDACADAITLGNHSWDQREALVFIERAPRISRSSADQLRNLKPWPRAVITGSDSRAPSAASLCIKGAGSTSPRIGE